MLVYACICMYMHVYACMHIDFATGRAGEAARPVEDTAERTFGLIALQADDFDWSNEMRGPCIFGTDVSKASLIVALRDAN